LVRKNPNICPISELPISKNATELNGIRRERLAGFSLADGDIFVNKYKAAVHIKTAFLVTKRRALSYPALAYRQYIVRSSFRPLEGISAAHIPDDFRIRTLHNFIGVPDVRL
jgi:hypothetical protein